MAIGGAHLLVLSWEAAWGRSCGTFSQSARRPILLPLAFCQEGGGRKTFCTRYACGCVLPHTVWRTSHIISPKTTMPVECLHAPRLACRSFHHAMIGHMKLIAWLCSWDDSAHPDLHTIFPKRLLRSCFLQVGD